MAVALDEQSTKLLRRLQPIWHDSAPRRVVDETMADDPLGNWTAWQKHLARRKRPAATLFLGGKKPPLLWGWPDAWRRNEIQAFLAARKRNDRFGLEGAAARFLLDDVAAAPDLPTSLQIVALAYALPDISATASAEIWWRLVERILDLASDGQQHRVDWPADPRDVVRQQLVAGELPLALGYLFPEVRALRTLRKTARSVLTEGLLELTDGQGLPHARLLPVLGPLFACWTRARWLGARLKNGAWSPKAEVQYEWLVRNALRLADKDARFLLTSGEDTSPAWTNDMLAMSLELAGDGRDCAAAATAVSRRVVPKKAKFDIDDLPNASLNSDWSGIAVMANGWSQHDVRLAVAYADDPLRIELSAEGDRLLAGDWTSETLCDGAPVAVTGEWERLCWESSKRYAFLELGIELSHGLRLERQLLLGREDRVLYLADIVVAADGAPRRLRHAMKLPLDASAAWRPEFETRDGTLVGRKTRAAVLPLSLHEWRSDSRGGGLAEEDGQLVLLQEANGRALCCPLFFDLDKKRAKKERTWRQLTVAEWMEILPRDAAVGFRAQSGRDQWIFYRSLGPVGNRTFLGQNIAGEFSAGRFLDSGKYKEWIEIEAV
ncbi:MAG: hypothetical protein L0228_02135 [Planctomycetes bacterium]|nr:hypothetical protein [Planctomycetota bacterium]